MNVKDICIAALALLAGALGPAAVLAVEAQLQLNVNSAAMVAGFVVFAVAILSCAGLHLCHDDEDEEPTESLGA